MEIARLRVTSPDGQVREHPIASNEVTIGAAPGNSIVIDHISVSPRHCRLVVSNGGFQLVDHGSDFGTFLDGRRIPADSPTNVAPDTRLRIGSVEAVLLGRASEPRPAGNQNTGGGSAPSVLTFRADLLGGTETIAPNGTATATVAVENQGRMADDYTLRIENQPSWIQMSRSTLSLAPGTRDEVTIVIRPPRSPEAHAGNHELAVAVWSREHNHTLRVIGNFHVERFDQPAMRVQPPTARGQFRATISNMGNAPVEYQLDGRDDEGKLAFDYEPESVHVPPGMAVDAALHVHTRERRLFSGSETIRFEAEAIPIGATPEPLRASAQVRVQPPLRHWKWFLLALILLALAGGGAFVAVRGTDDLPFFGGSTSVPPTLPTATVPPVDPTEPPDQPTEAPATVVPDELRVGGRAVVADLGPNTCLRVREEPDASDDTPILGRICEGDIVNIIDGPETSDQGFRFWLIQTEGGGVGWAAEGQPDGSFDFLLPIE